MGSFQVPVKLRADSAQVISEEVSAGFEDIAYEVCHQFFPLQLGNEEISDQIWFGKERVDSILCHGTVLGTEVNKLAPGELVWSRTDCLGKIVKDHKNKSANLI